MFNLEDKDLIMDLINRRDPEDMIIPLYIKIGNNCYSLLEVDQIRNCSPSIFKIGFGSSNSVFNRIKFPINELINFENTELFNYFDDDKQMTIQYIIFESSYVDDNDSYLNKNINKYYNMLLEYVMNKVEANKKELIKKTMEEFS